LAQAVGALGQEGLTDRRWQVAQFVIGGGEDGREDAVLLRLAKALVAGALGLQQGVADELGHEGEGDLLVVGASTMAVVEVVEGGVVADELPQQECGLSQRETR
jgi:hypothetical protein